MAQEDLTALQCPGRHDRNGSGTPRDCLVCITPEALELKASGRSETLPWRQVSGLKDADYRVVLTLVDGGTFQISHLGYQFDNALRLMRRFRNLQIAADLLFEEKVDAIYREFQIEYLSADLNYTGKGDLHCAATGLVFLPDTDDPFRIAVAEVEAIIAAPYELTLQLEEGGRLVLGRLGSQRDPLLRDIRALLERLDAETRELLASFWSSAPTDELARATRLLRDGRAAAHDELLDAAPSLWSCLEVKIAETPLAGEYRHFSSLVSTQFRGIGLKRGLWGDLASEYIYLLLALPASRAMVLEASVISTQSASDSDEPGKATYFFRWPENAPFDLDGPSYLAILRLFNRSLRAVNFRREPIYLPQEKLQLVRYQKYTHSLNRIPALQTLRRLFVGRVIHRSEAQWQVDCQSMLARCAVSLPQGGS